MVDGKKDARSKELKPPEETFGFQMENCASNNQALVCNCAARVELGVRAGGTYFLLRLQGLKAY